MANSETGDGQAAAGRGKRSQSKSRQPVEPDADGDSTETLKESVAELQTQTPHFLTNKKNFLTNISSPTFSQAPWGPLQNGAHLNLGAAQGGAVEGRARSHLS